MDAIVQMKTVGMLRRLAGGDLQHIGGYPFEPQKKGLYYTEQERRPLPRSTPELQGVDSDAAAGFYRALEAYHPHGAMLLRHGKVIAEGYWSPWQKGYANMVYSLSKSITGMAVGLAESEGLLRTDEWLVDIFPDKTPRIHAPRLDQLTVEHLLTMSSGLHFNESASLLERDWVRAALASDCAFAPGSRFFYNSLNSYLLAACVCRRAGMSLTDYLTPRLFSPMRRIGRPARSAWKRAAGACGSRLRKWRNWASSCCAAAAGRRTVKAGSCCRRHGSGGCARRRYTPSRASAATGTATRSGSAPLTAHTSSTARSGSTS